MDGGGGGGSAPPALGLGVVVVGRWDQPPLPIPSFLWKTTIILQLVTQ